jgi:hypothetical protein
VENGVEEIMKLVLDMGYLHKKFLHSQGVWLRRHHMQQNCCFCIHVAQMFKFSDSCLKWKLNFVNWYIQECVLVQSTHSCSF